MSLSRAIAWNTLVHALSKGGAIILGLVSFALLTRYLGTTGFGYYRTVLNYLGTASILTNLGLYPIVLRELSQDQAPQAYILGNVMALRLVTSIGFLIIAAVFSYLLPYDPVVHQGIIVAVLGFVALEGTHVLLAVFQQHLKQWQAGFAEILGAGVTLIAVGLVIYLRAGTVAALGTMVLGHVAWFTSAWYFAYGLMPFRLRWSGMEWQRLIRAALPMAGLQILNLMYLRVDAVVLSLYHPAADVGVYGIASKILEMSMTLPYIFAGLVMPLLSLHAHRDAAAFRHYVSTAFDVLAIVACGLAVVFYAFAAPLITWIGGAEFQAATAVLQLFSVAIGFYCLTSILVFAITALGQQRLMMRGYAVAATVSFLTYIILIPQFSYFGAAIGRLMAEAIVMVSTASILTRSMGGRPPLTTLLKSLAASVVTLGFLHLLTALGLRWEGRLILGAACFLGCLLLLRALPPGWSTLLKRRSNPPSML